LLKEFVWRDGALIAPMDPAIAAYTGAFGGWVAAHALLAATRSADDSEADPLSVSIDFLRGIGPGDVESRGETISSTRSLRFVRVLTTQGGELCAGSSIVLARRRPTDTLSPVAMPECAPPESLNPVPTTGLPVTWVSQYDLRFASGAPDRRQPELRTLVWVKQRDASALDYASLVAIADTPLPRVFMQYGTLSKITTVSMSVSFSANRDDLAAVTNSPVLVESWCTSGRHGYYDQQTRIWSRAGVLLATSSQIVWFNVSSGAVS
jgi:acyl-CoA thioesterase